jgi:pimeloyl-ACP methyl ester carboxylesterase
VLLIHAGIADRRMWDPQWERWSDRFTLIRYDLRGFGDSPDPANEYALHEDALAVLRAAGHERAAVVGCSHGARVAIDLALEQPGSVAGLVVVCGHASGAEWSPELVALADEADEALETEGPEAACELELRIWVDGTRPPGSAPTAFRDAIREVNTGLLRRQLDQAHGPTTPEPPADSRLGELAVPVLAVSAVHDQPWMREQASRMAVAVGGAEHVEVPDAAHLPSLERPELFDRAVLPFLERLS